MKKTTHNFLRILTLAIACLLLNQCGSNPISGKASGAKIARESRAALKELYSTSPEARRLGSRAKGILVFPKITKGGFMIGGMGGDGALIRNDGTIRDFYQTGGLSYGFQAGLQQYGYALFLMDNSAFRNLNNSNGWEIGSSPSLTVVDQGMAASLSTATMNSSTYAFFFDQQGLMGGLGLQGSKISRFYPKR